MTFMQLPVVRHLLTAAAAAMVVTGIHAVAVADEIGDRAASAYDDSTRSNQFYVALGAGISRIHPESECNCIAVGKPQSTGLSIAVGYDFSRWLSVEGYAVDLGSASIDFFGQEVGEVDYQVYGASVLATFYRSHTGLGFVSDKSVSRKGLSLYGRVGVGTIRTQTDLDFRRDNHQHAAFGIGMEYGMSRGVSVRGELVSYDTDARLVQVSLVKRFGGRSNAVAPVAAPVPINRAVVPQAPAPEPITVPAELPKTYFDFDQHTLTADAQRTVTDIAALLQQVDGLIRIDGHTDYTGTEDYNLTLSMRRANSVREALIAGGINESRLSVRAYGESRPAALNTTTEGRAQNRRVEITLRAQ